VSAAQFLEQLSPIGGAKSVGSLIRKSIQHARRIADEGIWC